MACDLAQAELALAQAGGNLDQAAALLLLWAEGAALPPVLPAGDDERLGLTASAGLSDEELGELWVLELDAHELRAYLQQNGIAMPASASFDDLRSEAVNLVTAPGVPPAARVMGPEPEPQPEPTRDAPAEGVPPSVVDMAPRVLALRRSDSWPSGGPTTLELKALARDLPRASDAPRNDVAWARKLEAQVSTASQMCPQSPLLMLLVSALHIIDRQEKKLEASVANVADESDRSERELRAERDLRLAREHSVDRTRSALAQARHANAKMMASEQAALTAAAEQKKEAAAQKKEAAAQKKQLQAVTKEAGPPPYWKFSAPTSRVGRFPTAHPKDDFQRLLRASSAPGHRGNPGAGSSGCRNDPSLKDPSAVVVRHVERVENWSLWQEYTTSKRNMMHRPGHAVPRLDGKANVSRLVNGTRVIDPSINEYWLWHGTNAETADIICKQGLDDRVASLSGLYGAGCYFADAFCKANQYAEKPNARGQHCVLFCRVLVGHAYCTDRHHQNERHPPLKHASDATQGFHDSIYAEIGVANGGSQKHNEFVIFEKSRVVRTQSNLAHTICYPR
jgi:hypothetical protein